METTINTKLEVCILAAGVGSRMKSTKAKVLQTLAGKPLLAHLLQTIDSLAPEKIHVVIGQGADQVREKFSGRVDINWVLQAERLGTGHAVLQASPSFANDGRVLILLGDAPLVSAATLHQLLSLSADLAVLSVDMPDPSGYGRIIRKGSQVTGIVEEKDTDPEQKTITEINTGVMVADVESLRTWLAALDNDNAQSEYLLTDIVEHANTASARVLAHKAASPLEVAGINTFNQLAGLERGMQKQNAEQLMGQGVQLMDPARFDLRGTLKAGKGVCIDVNVILEGDVEIGDNVSIGPNVVIKDCRIGNGCIVKANSVLEGAVLGENCSVGPFVRLRPGADLSDEVAIGNFVEIKKSTLGKGTKASHLAYLGDATIGSHVNIGAGAITCNYDGVNKHQTVIGDDVFVGTNASLVAPLNIGEGSTIGAGSTITRDVEANVLAIGRGLQKIITSWKRPLKK